MDKGYASPEIALKQRQLVDEQLKGMRQGFPPKVFIALEPALQYIGERQRGLRILDAGCASGYYQEVFNYFTPGLIDEYVGIDFNPGMVKLARKLYRIAKFYQLDLAESFTFQEPFDLVFSSGTIEYIRDWKKAIANLIKLSRRWILFHRVPLLSDTHSPTKIVDEIAYDVDMQHFIFNRAKFLKQFSKFRLIDYWPAGGGPAKPDDIEKEGWYKQIFLWEKANGNS